MRHRFWLCLALVTAGGLAARDEPPEEPSAIYLRPAPPTVAAVGRMRRWHRHTHGRLEPVLREWELLARGVRERPGRTLAAGCRRLGLALTRLEEERLPPAPDPSVSLHLAEALRALSEAADSCSQGALFLTSWRLTQADASWRELRGRLQLYELAP